MGASSWQVESLVRGTLPQSGRASIVPRRMTTRATESAVLMADNPLDVVFTAPHPDDLEILMGGTIAKLVKLGYRVGMIHMTDGEPTRPRHARDAYKGTAGGGGRARRPRL